MIFQITAITNYFSKITLIPLAYTLYIRYDKVKEQAIYLQCWIQGKTQDMSFKFSSVVSYKKDLKNLKENYLVS